MLSSFHRQVVNLALREDFLAFDHSISKSPTKCIKILQMLMTDTLVCLCHSCTQHFQTLSAQLDSLVRINIPNTSILKTQVEDAVHEFLSILEKCHPGKPHTANKGTLTEQVVIGIIDSNHTVEIENPQIDFQFELDAAISSIISE